MNLEEVIARLAGKTLDSKENWYSWKINEERLSQKTGIILKTASLFEKNIELKESLRHRLEGSDPDLREKLIRYYVADWGGVRSNSSETIRRYATSSPSVLISSGRKGVASWSKVLCIIDPSKYAIFDARVSISLNSLQFLFSSEKKQLYPVLPSRNGLIKQAGMHLKSIAQDEGWEVLEETVFYNQYLGVLETVSKDLNESVGVIEMVLFAKAIDLANCVIEQVSRTDDGGASRQNWQLLLAPDK